eukprot:4810839-Amphidinium_carterae.1
MHDFDTDVGIYQSIAQRFSVVLENICRECAHTDTPNKSVKHGFKIGKQILNKARKVPIALCSVAEHFTQCLGQRTATSEAHVTFHFGSYEHSTVVCGLQIMPKVNAQTMREIISCHDESTLQPCR